eukprot:9758945-Alexandrium_andersonii.AAC.1
MGISGIARKRFVRFRALSGFIKQFRALPGAEVPDSARKCPNVPEGAHSVFGQFRECPWLHCTLVARHVQ